MRTHITYPHIAFVVAGLLIVAVTPVSAQGYGWTAAFTVLDEVPHSSGFDIGAYPSITHDGYDGGSPSDLSGKRGAFLLLYRQNGPGWTGPTGFYSGDLESSILFGGSKTWWDIYLWTQDYTHSGNVITVYIQTSYHPFLLHGLLVIDYVPESLGWTGPMQYELDLSQDYAIPLPIATVTDPLQGTRMHITVFAVPEPSSLAALGLGIAGLCVGVRRRR